MNSGRKVERKRGGSWLLVAVMSVVPLGTAQAQETNKAHKDCMIGTEGAVAVVNFVNGTGALVRPQRLSLFIFDQNKGGPRLAQAHDCTDDAQLRSPIERLKMNGVVLSLHAEERVLKHRIPQSTAEWFPYQTWTEDDQKRYLERLRIYQAAAVALHDVDQLQSNPMLGNRACVARNAKTMLEIAAGGLAHPTGADEQLKGDLERARGKLTPMIVQLAKQGEGGACAIPSVTGQLFEVEERLRTANAANLR